MKVLIAILAFSFIAHVVFIGWHFFKITRLVDTYELALSQTSKKIQEFDADLQLANSRLAQKDELISKYRREIEEFPAELQKLVKKHDLAVRSRDSTIAALKSKIRGGTTVVGGQPATNGQSEQQAISYEWFDKDGRFHLKDPNIWESGNEVFHSNQLLSLKGWVFANKSGRLQIKRLEISEVRKTVSADGKSSYEKLHDSTATLVDSQFEYTEPDKSVRFTDVVWPKLFASYDTAGDVGVGVELLNLGALIDYANVGVAIEANPNFDDIFGGSLSQTRLGANLTYRLAKPVMDTNLGIAVGVSTPANDLGGRWALTGDFIFYLTN